MARKGEAAMEFNADAFHIFDRDWALVTAGDLERFNTMTVSWGGLGTLWGRPVATVYVKPLRYTHDFLERSDVFTVSFYPAQYRKALTVLGTLSGRDGDKVGKAGLTPVAAGDGVTFREACKTLVCRKIYRQDMDVAAMPADVAEAFYKTEAPHTMYIGQVLEILS